MVEQREGKSTLEELGVDGILKWILKKRDGKACTGFIWLRRGTSGGAVVYTVLNFRVPQNSGNSFSNSGTNSSRAGLFCMQFVSQSVMFDYACAQQASALYTALVAVPPSRMYKPRQSQASSGAANCLPRFGSA